MTEATGHTVITGLGEITGPADAPAPQITPMGRVTGTTVVRLSFHAGQVMADHKAGHPIIVLGQSGEIRFTVDGEEISLQPGTAVHVEAGVVHALTAVTDAAVSLLILTGAGAK